MIDLTNYNKPVRDLYKNRKANAVHKNKKRKLKAVGKIKSLNKKGERNRGEGVIHV